MSETRTVRLGDVCQVVSGATPKTSVEEYWDGDINWVTPADLSKLSGAYISETPRKITEAGFNSCATNLLPENSVLLSSRAPIGHVAINTVPMATNQGFKSLIPGDQILPKFLYYWIMDHKEYLQSLGVGATFKELSKKTVENIKLDIPPLEEQAKQVEIRDLQSTIAQKREHQQKLFEELKVARFRQIQSSSQLRTYTLGELITYIQAGESPKCESYPALSGKPGILKLSALAGRKFNELENKQVLEEFFPNGKHRITKGDILMSRKNTPELVGTVQFVEEEPATELYTPDLIYRIKLDETKIIPEYFIQISRTPEFRSKIESIASGSSQSMSNISINRISSITLQIPHIEAQTPYQAVSSLDL